MSTPGPVGSGSGQPHVTISQLPTSLDKREEECNNQFKNGMLVGGGSSAVGTYVLHKFAESYYPISYPAMNQNLRALGAVGLIAGGAYAVARYYENKCRADYRLPPK